MKKRKNSIRLTLYIKFIISIIIPTIIISIGYSYYFNSEYIERSEREANNILITTEMKVEQVLINLKEACDAPYISSEAFKALPLFINPTLEVDQLRLNEIERNYEEILLKIMFQSSLSIESLTFYGYEGLSSFVVSRASEGISESDYTFESESWYNLVKENHETIVYYSPTLPPYYKKYKKSFPTLSLVTNVRNSNTNKDIGMMVATIRANKLNNAINSTLIDKKDNLLLMFNDEVISSSRDISESDLNILIDTKYESLDGFDIFVENISDTNLKIVYLSSTTKMYKSLIYFLLICISLLFIELIIGLLIYRASSKEMVDDINLILDTMQDIAHGELDVEAPDSTFEYLQDFSDALNSMTKQLKKTIDDRYVAVISRQKAEYMALQSQINPHFLYNTLNGFIGLNRMGEQKKLEKSIISLTKLFRYTCTNNDLVPLQLELNFVKDYLKLQHIKYEDRLKIVYEIANESKNIIIPKLILQPLVENAIVHGLEPISEQVTITIKTIVNETITGNSLFISIKDNGVGCSSDKLQLSNSVALNNINDRIKLFKAESIINYRCKNNDGVEVMIIIPISEEDL
ncbi:MAG: sensor histidine kinase [Pleomorphochaeta sp.]